MPRTRVRSPSSLAGEAVVEQARHREVQHGIAEEFEALVVVGAVAAVRQRSGSAAGPG